MKNILTVNAGSSSIKSQVINEETNDVLVKITAERVGTEDAELTFKVGDNIIRIKRPANHEEAIATSLKLLQDPDFGIDAKIDGVGHRVVHGGELYRESMLVDDKVIDGITTCNVLAPLHNPACLLGIQACRKLLPGIPEVAVFDTAFHQSMPKEKYTYPIPDEFYRDFGVRKYGFHGISHKFLAEATEEITGTKEFKSIQFHLGQGASLCAVKNGMSVDTTMGLSPLAGIIMGTRSGDIDPAVVSYLATRLNIHHSEVIDILNKKSGMLALSGISSDFRNIMEAAESGNERAKLSLDIFYENVAEYAAKFMVALNGAKYFVFSGGIGENSPVVRSEICKRLALFGVELDEEANKLADGRARISSNHSSVAVYVIPTNEELMIARETVRVIGK